MPEMTSRERLLTTINHKEPDRVPICFRGTKPLDVKWNSRLERIVGFEQMGVDSKIGLSVPWTYHPDVKVKQWWETRPGEPSPYITKEIETPKGSLRLVVKQTSDYIPEDLDLLADHNWSRGVEYPVHGPEDLEKLSYVLYDPRKADLSAFYERANRLKSFAALHGVMVEADLPSICYLLFTLLGPKSFLYLSIDDPDFVQAAGDMMHQWAMANLEILLDVGVDTVYTQGSYETVEYWSPKMIRRLFLSRRKQEIDLSHQAGAKYHYFTQTGVMQLLDDYKEIGIDILSSLEPLGVSGDRFGADLAKVKAQVGDRICLWGGVDAGHTIEMGTAEDVREAVKDAILKCAPGGGFVLSTSGTIHSSSQRAHDNLLTFIEAGHEFGKYPIRVT